MDHMANWGECTSSHNTHVSWHFLKSLSGIISRLVTPLSIMGLRPG